MLEQFKTTEKNWTQSPKIVTTDMAICQSDYPLDWYQEEFVPYAEEYQALPDRKLSTILPWMQKYMEPVLKKMQDKLLLVAHYYMGGEIVKLVESFGGSIGDSYQLTLLAYDNPQKKIIVESAVHFMAESISILAHPDQSVFITNPKSGCTMEMHAKDSMVMPALNALNERYGPENILPVCYMNTSGRVKALTGAQGGAVCTSSNVKKIFEWAIAQNKKILFIPDKNMGENVAYWLDIPADKIAYWPGGFAAKQFNLHQQDAKTLKLFDESPLILFSSLCAVHDFYRPEMVRYWQEQGYTTIAHPECQLDVIKVVDSAGSTAHIWDQVMHDRAKTKRYAIATENHMVENLKQQAKTMGIDVVNIADAKIPNTTTMGCGCATMSRNDPPHLVGLIDLIGKDILPDFNQVMPGDIVNETTGHRTRLEAEGQQWIRDNARIALENMIRITSS